MNKYTDMSQLSAVEIKRFKRPANNCFK